MYSYLQTKQMFFGTGITLPGRADLNQPATERNRADHSCMQCWGLRYQVI